MNGLILDDGFSGRGDGESQDDRALSHAFTFRVTRQLHCGMGDHQILLGLAVTVCHLSDGSWKILTLVATGYSIDGDFDVAQLSKEEQYRRLDVLQASRENVVVCVWRERELEGGPARYCAEFGLPDGNDHPKFQPLIEHERIHSRRDVNSIRDLED